MKLHSVSSIQGKRDYMEDRYMYKTKNGVVVALVCDGHGGDAVAIQTAAKLPDIILNAMIRAKTNKRSNVLISRILREIILVWGRECKNASSGSTLTGITIVNDTVFVFNVGDSRTCFLMKPNSVIYKLDPVFDNDGSLKKKLEVTFDKPSIFCSEDHDAKGNEMTRIKKAKGFINRGRLNGILSVSRAFGDKDVGPGLSFVPDVYWTSLKNVTNRIIIYSDGMYESLDDTDKGAQQIYRRAMRKNATAKSLVEWAYNDGSEDNITIMFLE